MNLSKPVHSVVIFISLLAAFLFQCCAPASIQHPFSPFDHQKIADLISMGREQERRVHALFSSGHLTIKRHGSDAELNVLIAGIRDSGKIKIEITHPWGRPVLHILINKKSIQILSFGDKRYYSGHLGTFDPSGFFPGSLDPDQIWTIVRAYPIIREHNRVISLKENQIALLNSNDEKVQVIDFHPKSSLSCLMSFPGQDVKTSLSNFQNDNGIYYARKIGLNDPITGSILTLELKQMVFNKAILEKIFELEKPAGFEIMSPQRGL
ncbi:MAG: hypothetical protein H8D67_10145 [Deltaproteobacteria bacterium]|nr:hypothetical protein [Deltaproteobacteria bacterium]